MADKSSKGDLKTKNARLARRVFLAAGLMVCAAFAFVPLYTLFCRVTGFDGKPLLTAMPSGPVLDRVVTVKFDSNISDALPWKFHPLQRAVEVKLGAPLLIRYEAVSQSAQTTSGSALYNISPIKAAKYFHKVQCFCFNEQVLKPGERVEMPVSFYIDPKMNEDPDLADLTTITLSYSFYESDSSALDKALEDFYNQPASN